MSAKKLIAFTGQETRFECHDAKSGECLGKIIAIEFIRNFHFVPATPTALRENELREIVEFMNTKNMEHHTREELQEEENEYLTKNSKLT